MGRKIPGKKHRGVKDPLQQLAKKNERLKNKINAPPGNPDEQEIPRSVVELNRLRQMVKVEAFLKKKKKRNNGKAQTSKVLTHRRQLSDESEACFFRRINIATQDKMREAAVEENHKLTINRNFDGSVKNITLDQIKIHSHVRNNALKIRKTVRNKSAETDIGKNHAKLNRKQKLKLKKVKKKIEAAQDVKEFKTDAVKFGEVVHEPPQLLVRPRGTVNFDKTGKRKLLLSEIIN